MSNIIEYIEEAERLILSGKKAILGKNIAIDGEELLDLLHKIRHSLPEEVKEARQVIALRDKRLRDAAEQAEALLTDARKEEESLRTSTASDTAQMVDKARLQVQEILEQANLQRKQLLDEQDIIKQARQEADAITTSAQDYRKNILKEVGAEIDVLLEEMEEYLLSKLRAIRQARTKTETEFS